MLFCDIRRSVLSRRMIFTIMFGLICMYLPTFFLIIEEGRWIWENTLIASLQDAYGLGIYIFCAPATAAMCASTLYVQDKASGIFPFLIHRAGRKRYIASKVICCGVSGSIALAMPVLMFSFLQYTLYAGWQCEAGEWLTILKDTATFVPFGFVWATVGLALSIWTDSVQVAYASPYAIAMLMKILSSVISIRWLDPMRQVSPINTVLLNGWLIAALQGTLFLVSLVLIYKGVRRCAD